MTPRGSLRSRLFWAIGAVVLICIALTIGLGLVLTRRAVERATLQDLAHQADLIAATQRASVSSVASLPARIQGILDRQHELVRTNKEIERILPAKSQEQLAQGKSAQGTVTYRGVVEYFAARPVNPGTLVLLRPQSTATARWTPYVWGLVVAAAAGCLLAALAAFLLARRISRPVGRVAAIRGYAEALEDGAVGVHEAAATVALEARRLERLVRDLLDLARMNRTDFSVHNSEIDLAEVADDTVRRYQQQAEAFEVSLQAVADGPAPAVADADRVLQVVSNLVENALRTAPLGGEVRVVTAPGVVRVEDTGPGFAEADTHHAFERFYLHERYGRERPVGTGLGLAIVKELTLAMGGTVDVESRPGVLTAFTVRLDVPVTARETLPA
jgi:signal transduction histidine kinase